MKKVLFVLPTLQGGGAEKVVSTIASNFNNKNGNLENEIKSFPMFVFSSYDFNVLFSFPIPIFYFSL